MGTFLHQRRSSSSLIEHLVASHADESETLEFKGEFWSNQKKDSQNPKRITSFGREEAGKDVAALANGAGGDIILGITEDPATGRAAQFSSASFPKDVHQDLMSFLHASVVPPEMSNTVEVAAVDVTAPAGPTRVYVVSVPPWPHGPVAVRRAEGIDALSFPYRCGRHTRFMNLDEVMSRYEASNRTAYLKLRSFMEPSKAIDVMLTSPVEFEILGVRGSLPLPPRCHARLKSLTESGFDLEVAVTAEAFDAAAHMLSHYAQQRITAGLDPQRDVSPPSQRRYLESTFASAFSQTRIPVPLGLVRDAWPSGTPGDPVNLHLDAALQWVGARWLLRPGS